MLGVLTGFAIIGLIIAVGYIVGRAGLVVGEGRLVLNKVAFFVATPALLFTVLAQADIASMFSSFLLVSFLAVVISVIVYVLASRILFKRPIPETTIGAAASSYVNANNIGLPVAIYVIGDATFVAPVLLLQLLLLAPLTLTILDITTSGRASFRSIATQPLRNPMLIASAIGAVVSLTGVTLPEAVFAPFEILGGAAIPLVLLSFGMSLNGQRPLRAGSGRRDILTASAIKAIGMPLVAFLLGRFVFDLDAAQLFGVTVTAALPTAQNIYNFAVRYDRGVVIARDTALVTTIASMPVLFIISAFLAH